MIAFLSILSTSDQDTRTSEEEMLVAVTFCGGASGAVKKETHHFNYAVNAEN